MNKLKNFLLNKIGKKFILINIISIICLVLLSNLYLSARYLYINDASRFVSRKSSSCEQYLKNVSKNYNVNMAISDLNGKIIMKSDKVTIDNINIKRPFGINNYYKQYEKYIDNNEHYLFIWQSNLNICLNIIIILALINLIAFLLGKRKKNKSCTNVFKKLILNNLSRKIILINLLSVFMIMCSLGLLIFKNYKNTTDSMIKDSDACYVASRFVDKNDNSCLQYLNELSSLHGFHLAITDYNGNIVMKSNNVQINHIDRDHPFKSEKNIFSQVYEKALDNKPYQMWIWKSYSVNNVMQNILVFILIILAVIFSMYLYIRSKIKYIKYISNEIGELSKGNLNHMVEVKGLDELSILATEINNMSKSINEKIENERKEEKEKYELITNISHDLKTPLTSLIGYIQLLENKNIKEEEKEKYIKILKDKSSKLNVLIEDLFEYSKLESNGMILDRKQIDVIEIINQCIGEISPRSTGKNIIFNKDFKDEEVILNIDPSKIARVFTNIFENAIKYGIDNTEIAIKINKGENEILFLIENECDNIDKENINKIFERFYRSDSSRNSMIEGSGLGLSIVKSIMKLHDGLVYAEYQDNKIIISLKFII